MNKDSKVENRSGSGRLSRISPVLGVLLALVGVALLVIGGQSHGDSAGLLQTGISGAHLETQVERLDRVVARMWTAGKVPVETEFVAEDALREIYAALEGAQRAAGGPGALRSVARGLSTLAEAVNSQVRLRKTGQRAGSDPRVLADLDRRCRVLRTELRSLRLEFQQLGTEQELQHATARLALMLGAICCTGGAVSWMRGHLELRNRSLWAENRALSLTGTRLRSLLEMSSDVCLLLSADATIQYASISVERILGHPIEQLADRDFSELVHPDDWAAFLILREQCDSGPRVATVARARLKKRDGDYVQFEVLTNSLPNPEHAGWVVLNCRDITGRLQAEQALRESEQRYALAARGANDGLWDWKVSDGKIYYSPRWISMIGYQDGDLSPSVDEWLHRVHPGDRDVVQARLLGRSSSPWNQFQIEYRILHRDGTYRWMLCRGLGVPDARGQLERLVGSQTDITDRKLAERRLEYTALHDPLTGLPNRIQFGRMLEQALATTEMQPESAVVVLIVDLDHFKNVNDSLGHPAGDEMLRQFARRILRCVRQGDLVARLGGDEFGILLEHTREVSVACVIAERIQADLSESFRLGSHERFSSASIGIASNLVSGASADDLLRDADIALYEAKRLGKAQYSIFDQDMMAHATRRIELLHDLKRAIAAREFVVYYQPVLAMQNGALTGMEALVRWQHPERGTVSPAEFVPLAEEAGLIAHIDRLVLELACRQFSDWLKTGAVDRSLSVSINVSARRLAQPDLVEEIDRVLDETGIPRGCLRLEVTESAVIEDPERAAVTLGQLRSRGITIAMDDFGTGYSALGHLNRLPFDILKVDRSFLINAPSGAVQWNLVQSIIRLGHDLGMEVVAEGVETEQHLERLRELGCDYGQGYLWSRPVPATAMLNLLRSRDPSPLPRLVATANAWRPVSVASAA